MPNNDGRTLKCVKENLQFLHGKCLVTLIIFASNVHAFGIKARCVTDFKGHGGVDR